MYWAITHLNDAKELAAKLRRNDFIDVHQIGNSVVCYAENKPWAILSGYMTNSTQIYPAKSLESAKEWTK